jgi:iron complex outermembrane receptor protein
VNQSSHISQNVSKDFKATLPFLTANYLVNREWSVYAQFAEGMLVPDISSFQSSNASVTSIEPQKSKNYQAGIVHASADLAFDADVYYVDFTNKIAQVPGSPSSNPIFYNQGGVEYKGVEAEATWSIAATGFSLYGNATANRAESKASKKQIGGVPDTTAAAGVLFKQMGAFGSLIYKRVGRFYALDEEGYRLPGFNTLDFNVGYTLENPVWIAKRIKLQVGVFNVADKQAVVTVKAANATVGSATYGQVAAGDTFLFQPPRSYMASIRAEF